VDLRTGQGSPAPLSARTYADGCPQRVPGGRGLVYSSADPGTKLRSLVLAPTGEPTDGEQTMAMGSQPLRWLSPQDLLYAVDARRTAILSRARSTMLPDPPGNGPLVGAAVNAQGNELALVFAGGAGTSFVQRIAFPTLQPLEVRRLPGAAYHAEYDRQGGGLLLSLAESYWRSVYELEGGTLRRRGSIERAHLERVLSTPAGLVFTSSQVRTRVTRRPTQGSVVTLGSGGLYAQATVSHAGDVLMMERLADGRGVLVLQRTGMDAPVQLTHGPNDTAPQVDDDGRGFVYIRGDRNEVAHCKLDRAVATSCETIAHHGQPLSRASMSADGRYVVYTLRPTTGPRLGVLDRQTSEHRDLGPDRSGCQIRWSGPARFWAYQTDTRTWTETTLPAGQPTGRVVSPGDKPCAEPLPDVTPAPFGVTVEQWGETELRIVAR
jgi:hypothetical protein